MIRIEVEEYCQACRDFTADVIKPDRVYAGGEEVSIGDTIVRCEYRKRCAGIRRYLEHHLKEVEAVG